MVHPARRIGSVQRAIEILNLFNASCPELGTSEIARALGMHKSTAASLISTLVANRYLDQDPGSRRYRLGLRLLERGAVVLGRLDVHRVALAHLERLRDEYDETVNLAVLDGNQVVYVESLPSGRPLGMRSKVGMRNGLHCSALGKAILSCWPREQVAALIAHDGLPALTARTITDPERLYQELAETRARGFAVDDEENEEGGRCVAAPVFDHRGLPIAALSLSVPVLRLPLQRLPDLGRRVAEAAAAVSGDLGHAAPPARPANAPWPGAVISADY